ncbi:hypothetical protein [Staphylococcus saprophyticus]|uniref:hypothetical protein n=1 Tax=Staphylococcus saprophyticus TaxID=29385 RepID=UPI0019D061D3|nr:hypothetical protein [Staphylococcus saprophyticus]MBN6755858.1 hypothetical protein [Staphylococcus saprophyticus]MBN6765836.1 hypothetical protein [Staphylococcus saprophyticus]MBN6771263.1 hypothetical protein [Staphylococcus saprophyticus]MBN6780171.1 hypothetical protein [Staphylococcus saprophyticus]MBN6787601.1 hypothetical protein [Staphylococcus saprophyticus]
MYKQVFLYDGTPYLAYLNEDGEYNYPIEQWTETQPPEGIYSPFYFDGSEWVGSTHEEWLDTLPKQESDIPDSHDFLNAQLLANDLEHNSKIEDLQRDIANLTAELLKVQGGMSDVHDS